MNRMLGQHRWRYFVLLALSVACTVGCGDGRPGRVKVSGTVLIDGQPLERGTVMFIRDGARASRGKIEEDGSYTLTCYEFNDGVIPGTYKVTVSSSMTVGETATKWFAPKEYSSLATSGLEFTVEEETPDLKIELTWDGGKPYVEGKKTSKDATYTEE